MKKEQKEGGFFSSVFSRNKASKDQSNKDSTSKDNEKLGGRGYSLMVQPFFQELESANNILLSGCGGGYDFFSAVPLYFALLNAGKNVYIGNLTFTQGFEQISGKKHGTHCVEITAESSKLFTPSGSKWAPEKEMYFPELFLAKWFLETQNMKVTIFMFEKTGVEPLRKSYEELCKSYNIDTIVLCDGGTDSLMRGDEADLGTPTEDMASIAAVYYLESVKKKYLACLGFGIDSFHGVSHHLFLENVAALAKDGGFFRRVRVTEGDGRGKTVQRILSCLSARKLNSLQLTFICG